MLLESFDLGLFENMHHYGQKRLNFSFFHFLTTFWIFNTSPSISLYVKPVCQEVRKFSFIIHKLVSGCLSLYQFVSFCLSLSVSVSISLSHYMSVILIVLMSVYLFLSLSV